MSDIKKILSTVDNSINGFMGKVPAVEQTMYEEILKLTKELRLQQYGYITSYKLRVEHARTNSASKEVKYIIDSNLAPFTGDVIRVEEIVDEIGDVLEINSTDYTKVALLPSMDVIEIPNPTTTIVTGKQRISGKKSQ